MVQKKGGGGGGGGSIRDDEQPWDVSERWRKTLLADCAGRGKTRDAGE